MKESLKWWFEQPVRFRTIAGSLFFGVSIMLTDEQIEVIYTSLNHSK